MEEERRLDDNSAFISSTLDAMKADAKEAMKEDTGCGQHKGLIRREMGTYDVLKYIVNTMDDVKKHIIKLCEAVKNPQGEVIEQRILQFGPLKLTNFSMRDICRLFFGLAVIYIILLLHGIVPANGLAKLFHGAQGPSFCEYGCVAQYTEGQTNEITNVLGRKTPSNTDPL